MTVDLRTCTSAEAAVLLAVDVQQIVTDIILRSVLELDQDRTGGWFAFWRGDPNGVIVRPVFGFSVGLVTSKRYLRCIHFANEKAVRLAQHPTHISSFQSRDESDLDPMMHKYGGAIRCGSLGGGKHLIFSFSGFSELEDEAVCVILARRGGWLSDHELNCIIKASGNERLVPYLNSSNTERPS